MKKNLMLALVSGVATSLAVGCASVGVPHETAALTSKSVSRAPASVPSVLRKLFAESSEEGGEWLTKHFAKEGADAGRKVAVIRNGLATLRPAEIREDQELVRILGKQSVDVTEDEVKYLYKVASTRAVQLANCQECVAKKARVDGLSKLIKASLMMAAGTDDDAKRQVVGFIKRLDAMMAKDMVDPKAAHAFVTAVQAERFSGPQVAALMDSMHLMLSSMGKDLDPKAAAEIINNWPESSLRGLRRFYSEVMMVQTAEGMDVESAAEAVLKRLSVSDPEEIRVMKVCSLLHR